MIAQKVVKIFHKVGKNTYTLIFLGKIKLVEPKLIFQYDIDVVSDGKKSQHYTESNNMSKRLPANESAKLNRNVFVIIKLFMENKQAAIWKRGTKWSKYLRIKNL